MWYFLKYKKIFYIKIIFSGFNTDLITTSGFGAYKTIGVKTGCPYYYKFSSKHSQNTSKRSPCINRLVHCLSCQEVVWSYNFGLHYLSIHPTLNCSVIENCQPKKDQLEALLKRKIEIEALLKK